MYSLLTPAPTADEDQGKPLNAAASAPWRFILRSTSRRWNRNPRPQPQTFSKLVSLIFVLVNRTFV